MAGVRHAERLRPVSSQVGGILARTGAGAAPEGERIISAIRDGDAKVAEAAMREHMASVIEALRSIDQLGGPA